MHIYTVDQIRTLEQSYVSDGYGTLRDLMEKAGYTAWQQLHNHFANLKTLAVVCGSGGNGGDGYVLARHAAKAGLKVTVYQVKPPIKNTLCFDMATLADLSGVGLVAYQTETQFTEDGIVDAIFGIGIEGDVNGIGLSAINSINLSDGSVISLDVPSGLDANKASPCDQCVKAEITVTFMAMKAGLITGPALDYTGSLVLETLDVPPKLYSKVQSNIECLNDETITNVLPKRNRNSHKGDYGNVLVIGGHFGMGGAPRLAAEAALRVGAGSVCVGTRSEHISAINAACPEIMCHTIACGLDLKHLVTKAKVIIIGPGLGQSTWSKELLFYVLENSSQPKIIDADALNILSKMKNSSKISNWILTPHPGEAARLLNQTISEIQKDRYKAAAALQQKYGGVLVLKGAGTIIATKNTTAVCSAGNPGMATAGMGDVLSGVLGGLLAQGLTLNDASYIGVQLHARAADLAAKEHSEYSLIASDLFKQFAHLMNSFQARGMFKKF